MHDDDEDDDALWREVTEDIQPLKGGRGLPSFIPRLRSRLKRRADDFYEGTYLPLSSRGRATDLDKRTAERLQQGQLPIQGRIDLHGMTQAQAQQSLQRFIRRAYDDGKRCILVITGKGVRMDEHGQSLPGILRAAVPSWLSEEQQAGRVLRWHNAQPQHGGDGALYVLLRRQR